MTTSPLTKYFRMTATLIAGIAVGWVVKPDDGPRKDGRAQQNQPEDLIPPNPPNKIRNAAGDPSEQDLERFLQPVRSVARLSPREFSEKLSGLMREGLTAEETLWQSALISLATPEQGAAFFMDYQRKYGAGAALDNKEMKNFLMLMGQTGGQKFMGLLQQDFPKGFDGFDSVTHGWAKNQPAEAVDWFNSLGIDHPKRELMWGVAQSNADTAITVFNSLAPEDRSSSCINAFANSLIANHGFEAIDKWFRSEPDPSLAQAVLKQGMYRAERRPPADSIPWLAGKLENHPDLQSNFQSMCGKWAAQDPAASAEWLARQGKQSSSSGTSLKLMAKILYQTGQFERMDSWLAANPGAPGFSAIKSARDEVAGRAP